MPRRRWTGWAAAVSAAALARASVPSTAAAGVQRIDHDFEYLDEDDVSDYVPENGLGQREAWRNRLRQVYVGVRSGLDPPCSFRCGSRA